jgi:hypothetical protein
LFLSNILFHETHDDDDDDHNHTAADASRHCSKGMCVKCIRVVVLSNILFHETHDEDDHNHMSNDLYGG